MSVRFEEKQMKELDTMSEDKGEQESKESCVIERKTVEVALRAIGEYKNKSSVLTIAQQKLVAILYYEEFVSLGNIVRYLKEEENVTISKSAIHKGLFRWKKYISNDKYEWWCLIRNRPIKNSKNPKKRTAKKNANNSTKPVSLKSLEDREKALIMLRNSGEITYDERRELKEVQTTLKGNK